MCSRHRKKRHSQKLTPSGSDERNGYSKVNTHYSTRGTRKYLRQSRRTSRFSATHTSVWPRERFFFSFLERENVVVARVPLNHSTNGWYLFLNSSGTRSKTNESTIRCRTVKKKSFEREKEIEGAIHGGAKFQRQAVRQSGKYRLAPTTTTRFISPLLLLYVQLYMAGDDGKSRDASATYGRLLHPITSSNNFFCADSPTTSSVQIFYYFDNG